MKETIEEKLKRLHEAINQDPYQEHLKEKKELWKMYQLKCKEVLNAKIESTDEFLDNLSTDHIYTVRHIERLQKIYKSLNSFKDHINLPLLTLEETSKEIDNLDYVDTEQENAWSEEAKEVTWGCLTQLKSIGEEIEDILNRIEGAAIGLQNVLIDDGVFSNSSSPIKLDKDKKVANYDGGMKSREMKCPHCGHNFTNVKDVEIEEGCWDKKIYFHCPHCKRTTIVV